MFCGVGSHLSLKIPFSQIALHYITKVPWLLGGGGGNCLEGTGCIPGAVPKHGGSALPSRAFPEAVSELELHAVEGASSLGGSGCTR